MRAGLYEDQMRGEHMNNPPPSQTRYDTPVPRPPPGFTAGTPPTPTQPPPKRGPPPKIVIQN